MIRIKIKQNPLNFKELINKYFYLETKSGYLISNEKFKLISIKEKLIEMPNKKMKNMLLIDFQRYGSLILDELDFREENGDLILKI